MTPAQIELLAWALYDSAYRQASWTATYEEWEKQAAALLAQLGSLDPLGAVAMREKAAQVCGPIMGKCNCDACCSIRRARDAIHDLPLPAHADRLAAALALPEIARLVKVAKWAQGCIPFPSNCHSEIIAALAALTPTATGETKGDA